jgi:two-component system cell cycle sensor histidine kinase/response regulator CckA
MSFFSLRRTPVGQESASELPDPAEWVANTLRRRLLLVSLLTLVAVGFAAAGTPVVTPIFALLGIHFASVVLAREVMSRRDDRGWRTKSFTAFLFFECLIIAALTHYASGSRWVGVSGLLLQMSLPSFALPRRSGLVVLTGAMLGWWTMLLLEVTGVLIPPALPGLPPQVEGAWTITIASAITGSVFLMYAATSARSFRRVLARSGRQLRQSEARYRATIAALRDVVFRVDRDGRWTYLSPPWLGLTGQDPAAALGRKAELSFHPDDQAAVRATVQSRTSGSARQMCEVRIAGPNGEWRTVELRPQVEDPNLDDGDGNVSGTIADISERVALRDQAEQAARLDAVGRLAGGVAHDVNNVLTTIQVQADALQRQLPASLHHEVRPVHEAVARGALLIRQLLSFGRRQQVAPSLLDLGHVLRTLEGLMQRVAGPEHTLQVRGIDGTWVRADPIQLEQIVGVLVTNARDASAAATTIRVDITAVDVERTAPPPLLRGAPAPVIGGESVPPGRWVVLRVEDEGTGINPSILPRVFEPFFTTKPGGGTGLGLATVYGAARQSQGVVRIGTGVGVGTTVEVFLPRAEASATLPAPAGSTTSGKTAGATLLLVEDEETLRIAVRRMLERRGYNVLDEANGRLALAALAAVGGRVDAIVTDVVMPDLDGRGFVREASQRWPGIRVLFISGYTAGEAGHAATTLDGHPLLQKPFTADALDAAVQRLLADR